MGGSGSGRWSGWGWKATTESQLSIDIRWLKKHECLQVGKKGYLSWTWNEEETGSVDYRVEASRLVLNYRYRENSGGWEDVRQAIAFDWTPCNYGGKRQWLVCPGCARRVALLYGGKYFLCRHCHNLSYASQQETKPFRLLRKAQKIRKRLGASNDLTEPIWRKPKNMHRKTLDRLQREAENADNLSMQIMRERFGDEVDRYL